MFQKTLSGDLLHFSLLQGTNIWIISPLWLASLFCLALLITQKVSVSLRFHNCLPWQERFVKICLEMLKGIWHLREYVAVPLMIDFMIHQRHVYLTEWKILTKIGSTSLHPTSRGDTCPSRCQVISLFISLKAKYSLFSGQCATL